MRSLVLFFNRETARFKIPHTHKTKPRAHRIPDEVGTEHVIQKPIEVKCPTTVRTFGGNGRYKISHKTHNIH